MNPKSLLLAAALALVAGPGLAQDSKPDYKLGAIEIERPWARATPKGATVGAGYMKITNKGTEADRLLGGSVAFAKRFELHSMVMEQGVMRMREVKDGLEIKPGQTVELKPGGYHVMFVDLMQPLAQGDHVKVTLSFAKAGTIDVEYAVEAIGANVAPKGTGGHDMKMGH
jgi:copper(I)-binding protein